jgi:hypothetical protein
MKKSQKPSNSVCYTSSSEPFGIYLHSKFNDVIDKEIQLKFQGRLHANEYLINNMSLIYIGCSINYYRVSHTRL